MSKTTRMTFGIDLRHDRSPCGAHTVRQRAGAALCGRGPAGCVRDTQPGPGLLGMACRAEKCDLNRVPAPAPLSPEAPERQSQDQHECRACHEADERSAF